MAQLSVESAKITEDAASPLYNMAERGVLGGNAGKDYAVRVLEGGSGKAIAGHGVYISQSKDFIIPKDITVLAARSNTRIHNATGRFLETVDPGFFSKADNATRSKIIQEWIARERIRDPNLIDRIMSDTGKLQVFPPGSSMPNYTIKAPDKLIIYENSTTVESATSLSDLIKPKAGCIALATCTSYYK